MDLETAMYSIKLNQIDKNNKDKDNLKRNKNENSMVVLGVDHGAP